MSPEELIAPCGMNCNLCIGHLRDKKPCSGCFTADDPNKPAVCRSCTIVNCVHLAETPSGFCYDCSKFPCTRLKNLDKRYRTNYGMSMLENLMFIQNNGVEKFVMDERERWKCEKCGAVLSVHRHECLHCHSPYERKKFYPKQS